MKKRRSVLRRIFASALTVAMVGTMLPATALAAETKEASKGIIAQFDFDDEAGGFTGGGAKASGTYELKDSYDGAGKALYLNGSSQFLSVTKEDGSSLLTGLKEMTVSFEMKSDRTATNWPFYAAPSTVAQPIGGNGKEIYFGLLVNGGNITAERYLNGRSNCAASAMNSGWSHVDVVVSSADTAIYIDGVEKSRVASANALSGILGDSSILQIGKANWGNGEYCKGWIDNMTIYDHALNTEELQAAVPAAYKTIALDAAVKAVAEVTISDSKAALPDYDGTVTWKSDMKEIVIAENGISAVVTQPAKGEAALKGELTAVVTLFGEKKEVKVPVTVEPGVDPDDYYGYLMVHFVEDSEGYQEKIYLDISRGDNPQQWDPLNGRQPIVASNLGTTGSRDPFITYNPETKTYYIIATDLRVFGGDNGGWGVWQDHYSTKMNVWESKDLIHWSDVRQYDVALNANGEKEDTYMGMMWAPEATWVPDYYEEGKGAFVVYWSSMTDSGYSKIMWGATPDFTQETYEFGGVMIDPGYTVIDTTILQTKDKTYHITKSNGNSDELYMESTTAKRWWEPGTKWTKLQTQIGRSRYGAVEGPAVFTDHNKENSFYLFVDDLPQPGYQPMYTENPDNGWDYLDSSNYFLTSMTKHGGVISLTKAQYDALRDADAVSAVKENVDGVIKVKGEQSKEDIIAQLPKEAEVNLAYNRGTSVLPLKWDLSGVNMNRTGTYTAKGIVQSIGANKNQWVGKDDSTHYLAEDKQLYSSTEVIVKATVEVDAGDGIDKSELEQVIKDALPDAEKEKYTEKTWDAYAKALAEAKKVMDNEEADQQTIDDAVKAVKDSQKALEKRPIGKLVASYDMTAKDGKLVDITGNGHDAAYVGFTDGDFQTEGEGDAVLVFDGTEKYVKLPAGLIGTEKFTIDATFKTNTAAVASWLWCLGAKDNNDYVFISPDFFGSVIRSGIKLNGTEQLFGNGNAGSITMGQYTKMRMSYDNGEMKLYVNDNPVVVMNTSFSIQDVLKAGTVGDVCGYIGKSLYSGDAPFTGTLTQFDVYAEPAENPQPTVDKTALEKAIADAEKLEEAKYTADSWKKVADALADAKKVLADAKADQAAVDAAKEALDKAIKELKEKPVSVDKSKLDEAVKTAEPAENKDKYTEETWTAYEKALEEAKKVLADAKADQAAVDAAVKALADAKEALAEKPSKLPYDDVAEGAWYYDAVAYNYYAKTMTGLKDNIFGPADTLVRAQFAAVLHKMNEAVEVEYTDKFSDVTKDDWFKNPVLWAAEKEIVTGYTGTDMFGPNDVVTREQMATMMYRYARNYKKYDIKEDGDYSAFPDAENVQPFAQDAMKWAVAEGIITGKTLEGQPEDKKFLDPQGSANRAECATIIQRFMEKYEK